jgi:hypothetical protein
MAPHGPLSCGTDNRHPIHQTHQLLGHDLALVHEVVDEAVLLPVEAVDLPRRLVLALPLVLLVDRVLHLLLKVLYDVLYLAPALGGALVLELAS